MKTISVSMLSLIVEDTLVRHLSSPGCGNPHLQPAELFEKLPAQYGIGEGVSIEPAEDDVMVEKINTMVLVHRTEKTIVDKKVLTGRVEKSQILQYTLCREEYLPGLVAIGAPLFDPISGKGIGAVSFDFSVLQHSADVITAKYGDMIRETARTLSDPTAPGQKL